jgi:hypothetical protein
MIEAHCPVHVAVMFVELTTTFYVSSASVAFTMVNMNRVLAIAVLALLQMTVFAKRGEEAVRRIEKFRKLIAEVGPSSYNYHNTTLCSPEQIGSTLGCYTESVRAIGNVDYLLNATEVTFPTNGAPWGISLNGPYPDGVTYRISWQSGNYSIGPNVVAPDTSMLKPVVKLTHAGKTKKYTGSSITYMRSYTLASQKNKNYLSPIINHVILPKLKPGKEYTYVAGMGSMFSEPFTFKTLPLRQYPLRIGLIADVGQTVNSTVTRDHLIASNPQVIFNIGDLSYADDYDPNICDAAGPFEGHGGTCQPRWDAFATMWQSAWSRIPFVSCNGDHEIESANINATETFVDQVFSYPTNYPFLAWSSRYPAPGIVRDFGNINNNLYYHTIVAGLVHMVIFSNYYAFGPGTNQYTWAIDQLMNKFDRSVTPFLFVVVHAPPYHTYQVHYKEMECFMSIYEDYFYAAGVDLVLNGHVHGYERTHPMYKYQEDTCGPAYFTLGDGGNLEGPYRDFVDQVDPLDPLNRTYCELLNYGGLGPNQMEAANKQWGPSYQIEWQDPICPTITWQPANGVAGGPPLVLKNGSSTLGFCQSSQPTWSAHRDPSFGHAVLTLLSDTEMYYEWNRDVDGVNVVADSVTLSRVSGCDKKRMAMKKKLRKMARKYV